MRARFAIFALALVLELALASGCSSVPVVEYRDVDGGVGDDDPSGRADGGTGQEYNCTDRKPPPERGVCCGPKLCLGCSESHCAKCERGDCEQPAVCCARNQGTVDCRRPSSCGPGTSQRMAD